MLRAWRPPPASPFSPRARGAAALLGLDAQAQILGATGSCCGIGVGSPSSLVGIAAPVSLVRSSWYRTQLGACLWDCRQVNTSSQAAAVSRGKMVPTEKLAQTCEPIPAGLVTPHPGNPHVLLAPSPLKDVERNNKRWMIPFSDPWDCDLIHADVAVQSTGKGTART